MQNLLKNYQEQVFFQMANVSDVNFVIPCHELYMRTVLQKRTNSI